MTVGHWLAYHVGTTVGRSLAEGQQRGGGPVRQGTEADFRADEARFKQDEARIEAEIAAAKKRDHEHT
ncbi:MAG: hypothetical protein ACXVEF_06595 [Polyangiales bacterium]